jgi:tRNA threonylcarbamoyladenosine biosynthesis protein TsaB
VLVLALETATACAGCALWTEDGPLASFTLTAGPRHAEVLMPAVDQLFRVAGRSPADIDGVAVDVGPGLFTGLRVGLATAGAIALARAVPAVGVTSVEALAHPHRRRSGLVAAVVDARRAEVYWALYRSDGAELEELEAPAVAAPEAVAARLVQVDQRCLLVGDGAWRYRDVLAAGGGELAGPADMWPSPLVVAELGAHRLAEAGRGAVAPGSLPKPVYLRQADVRIGWEEVGGRVGPEASGAGGVGPLASGAGGVGPLASGAGGVGPEASGAGGAN